MASKNRVWEDGQGLYVITGGYIARPGVISEYAHDLGMKSDSHILKAGDKVRARHINQTKLVRITCECGVELYWEGKFYHG